MLKMPALQARLPLLFFLALIPASGLGLEEPDLTISPGEVYAGEAVVLRWSAPAARSAFLTGVGLVEPAGERQIVPRTSRFFTLVSEGSLGIATVSRRLEVRGSRGPGEEEDDASRFAHPLRGRVGISSLVELLDRIHTVLQDRLGFSVRSYEVPGRRLVFVTDPSQRSDLVKAEESRIGARRLAYRVEIELPDKLPAQVTYTIRTAIQFRRRIESTWRPEESEALHREQAERLRSLFIGPP